MLIIYWQIQRDKLLLDSSIILQIQQIQYSFLMKLLQVIIKKIGIQYY